MAMKSCLHSIIIRRWTQEESPREQKVTSRMTLNSLPVRPWGDHWDRWSRETTHWVGKIRTQDRKVHWGSWICPEPQRKWPGVTALSDSGDSNRSVAQAGWQACVPGKESYRLQRLSVAPAGQGWVKGSSSVTMGRPGPWGPAQSLLHALQGIITLSVWLRAAVRWGDRHRPAPDGLVNRGQENAGCGSWQLPHPQHPHQSQTVLLCASQACICEWGAVLVPPLCTIRRSDFRTQSLEWHKTKRVDTKRRKGGMNWETGTDMCIYYWYYV